MLLKRLHFDLFLFIQRRRVVPRCCATEDRFSFRRRLQFGVSNFSQKHSEPSQRTPGLTPISGTVYQILLDLFTIARSVAVRDIAIVAVGLGSIIGRLNRTQDRPGCSSELCCPGAKLQSWAPPLVTSFAVIFRVE